MLIEHPGRSTFSKARKQPASLANRFIKMAQNERPDDENQLHWKHMNSLDMNSFGSLDDIRSFTESPTPSPSQQEHQQQQHHHHNNMESNQLSHHPHTIMFPTNLPAARPLVNAVHIEMQENARLPSFNLAVDRSNEYNEHSHYYYNQTALSPQTRREIDDLIRLEDFDKSFSEYFLKSDQRNSLTLTYEAAGALLDEVLADPHVFDTVMTTTTTNSGPNSAMTSRSNSHRNVMMNEPLIVGLDHDHEGDIHIHDNGDVDDDHDDQKLPATTGTTTASSLTAAASSTMDTTTNNNNNNNNNNTSGFLDEDLINMMIVEPTPLDQIKARGARWNLQQQLQHQQHPQRYFYPMLPRQSPLPIPTGISMNVSTPNNNNNVNDQQQQQPSPHVVVPSQASGGGSVSTTTSPLSSALATAAAIAAATAAATSSTPSPKTPQAAAVMNDPHATNSTTNNNNTFAQSNQHSSFHRVTGTTMPGPLSPSYVQNNTKEHLPSALQKPIAAAAVPAGGPKSPMSSVPLLPILAQMSPSQQARRASYPLLPSLTPTTTNRVVTTTQAMASAANMKSQFGFGGNHVVPSVPDPPPKPGTTKAPTSSLLSSSAAAAASTTTAAASTAVTTPPSTRRMSNFTSAAAAGMVSKKPTHPKPLSDNGTRDSGSPSSPTHTGEAYERKKQRAKDSRVRLNESIDRLSIAMSMAGSQSKQRADQLRGLTTTTSSSSVLHDKKISSLIRIMEDASTTAEQAKKWDRPSFVGVAATLIQGLNAECEALMELLLDDSHRQAPVTNQEQSQPQKPPQDVNPNAPNHSSTSTSNETTGSTNIIIVDAETHHEIKRSKSIALSPGHSGVQELHTKRQRVGSIPDLTVTHLVDDEDVVTAQYLFSQPSIVHRLAFYFDPISLLRCKQVSSSWKKIGIFSSDMIWMALLLTRYGRHQVREWMNSSSTTMTTSVELYRRMDEANVMPHFRQEGMVRLGEGRIGSKVSAWAFLVKRSNGETTRSVKREPSDLHNHTSAYLQCEYVPLPVVEMRIVVQNTGSGSGPIIIKNQVVAVDASTRRRGEEYRAITCDDRLRITVRKLDDDEWDGRRKMSAKMMDPAWDDQFKMTIWNVDGGLLEDQFLNSDISNAGPPQGSANASCLEPPKQPQAGNELCRLGLYDAQVVTVFLHVQGCNTMTKFQERSNFTKLLVCLNGTTVPLVIPFPREDAAR